MSRTKTVLKRAAACVLACLTAGASGGCSAAINVDQLLTPPKLSAQQEQIYQALKDTTGSDIRLKYPKRGAYLSAFILADLDGDNAEEAIAFYENNSSSLTDPGLRINVLDSIDGQWQSICDRSAEGTEIEKFIISPLGASDRVNVIVGYSTANQSEKSLCVYSYSDDYLDQKFSHSYALFDVADTGSGNANPDLIVLGADSSSEQASAAVYRLEADDRYHEYKYSFTDDYTDYNQLIYGRNAQGDVMLYVDAATGTANLQTEILCMEDTRLSNMLERCGRKAENTVRRAGLACVDIDNDGTPEIPVQTVFRGYEAAAESEQMRQTRWLRMREPDVYTEYYSYYSTGGGYAFLLPEDWTDRVTVRNDTASGELQFVEYSGEWTDDLPVLLRIYISYDEEDTAEHLADGFSLLHTKGTASYLVRAEQEQTLSRTLGTLLPCFRFLN